MSELLEKENKLVGEVATNGSYPLMFAAEKGHTQAVLLLLKYKADINAVVQEGGHKGASALWWAACKRQWDMVQNLLNYHVDAYPMMNPHMGTVLWAAVNHQRWGIVHELLSKDIKSLDWVPPEGKKKGKTALLLAAEFLRWDIVQTLLEKGVKDLDAVFAEGPNMGKSALCYAAESGQAHIISLLLAKGANIDIHPKGAAEIVRQVKRFGTVIDAEHDKSIQLLEAADTLFNIACDPKIASEKCQSTLQTLGKALNGRKKGATALHQAASADNIAVMDELIARGADLYMTNAQRQKLDELNDSSSLLKAFIIRDKLKSLILVCEKNLLEKEPKN